MADSTDSTIQAESGGDPTAHNARSSAAGLGQFIDPTWLATVKAHAPDVAAGKSDDEILALKNDPTLAAQPQNMQLAKNMTGAYASDNQAILSKAGLPVTPGTTYLAHFAGPGGAVKVLQADPGADVGGILGPAAVAANPFLKGMTAQGLQSWAAGRVGTTSPRVAQGAPGTPAAPPAPPAPPAAPPIFAGAAPAAPPVAAYQDPAAPPMQPLFAAQHKPIDLSGLRAALAARQGPIFANSQS
jgi:hypothetical protein